MKVARDWSADELRVRLCFFVKVLNASGRKVGGGKRIGRMVVMLGLNAGGGGMCLCVGWIGCSGVPNAGEDEKIGGSGGIDVVMLLEGFALLFQHKHYWCSLPINFRTVIEVSGKRDAGREDASKRAIAIK